MTTTRTALPLPTMDDVLRELNAGDPETVVLITRSMVRPGPPDGIDWDDPAWRTAVADVAWAERMGQRCLEFACDLLIIGMVVAGVAVFGHLFAELIIHLGK